MSPRLNPDAVGRNGGVCNGKDYAIAVIEVLAGFLLHRSLRFIAKLLEARDWNPGAIPVGMTVGAVISALFATFSTLLRRRDLNLVMPAWEFDDNFLLGALMPRCLDALFTTFSTVPPKVGLEPRDASFVPVVVRQKGNKDHSKRETVT